MFISALKKILNSKVDIRFKDLKGDISSASSKINFSKNQYKNINKIFLIYDFEHEKN